ncbi:disease resistance protein Roq1-like isoform X2 [Cryptomeria japonica]|uniref:disease resistance protein Roq1-like isoform X2 n=1 Tax=Cryptomeria japonica TaxID=3369 RepID=UPI0027DAAEFF|nr:disease resistance protein Roq1-like isoform X2 [Cryptomeria japonica]
MASSSSSSHSKKRKDGFSGIEPPGTRRKASDSTTLYDVFINHRGPDSKQTLALPLYESLEELGIRAFLDKEEMELGQSFPSAIETAINSALVHIAIISKRYAESPWCLQELILMQQTKAKIIPVFYGVEPWEVRYIEKGAYADAFIQYQNKSRYLEKLDVWKKALQDISFTAGHEIKDLNDYERIVIAVQKEVQRGKRLHVAKYPVALDKLVQDFQRRCLEKLVQDFEIKRGQNERKGKAGIVGIFGIGGVGKTTLCKELFNRKRGEYDRACFLFDVREASARSKLPSLQKQLLKDLFGVKKPSFQSTEEGSSSIFDHIERSELPSFLVVLDDINHLDQLETFMIMDLLKKPGNSLVIISTRDVGVLKRAGVEVCYHLQGMDKVDSRDLFSLHAFSQPHPATGYEDLVDAFLRVCGGLPLSLKVLGRHVHNQDINYWRIALDKYGERLHVDIKQILKISYDALETEEKQIFIDIACFFVDNLTDTAIRVWKASGWKAEYGLQTLKDRCLVEEINDSVPVLRMHDHLRDLGREMANEPSHPPRLWRPRDLKNLEPKGFENILIQTKRRCFHSFFDESLKSRITFLLGELDDSAAISTPLLLLQLDVEGYLSDSIPSWIPLQNMQCCTINGGHFNRLWRQDVQAPSQLKVLEISEQCNIIRLVISGNHCPKLQFLELSCMENLIEVKFTNCEDFERLNSLKISDCKDLKRLSVTSDLTKLEELNISACSQLDEASLDHLQYLKRITISDCNLKSMRGISSFTKLVELNISRCSLRNGLSLEQLVCLEKVMIENCSNLNSVTGISYLPKLVELSISLCWKLHLELRLVALNFLKRITVDSSLKVKSFELDGCKHLETVSGTNINFSKIQMVTISACPELRELPVIYGANCLEKITINGCVKLNYLQLTDCRNLKGLSGNFDLAELSINDCPMLAELPFFGHATCLKEIRILRCGNLENITLPTTLKRLELNACGELKNLTGISALKELVGLNIHACPKLQDLGVAHLTKLVDLEISECRELELCLSGMSCLENIAIIKSEKLQTITLP